MKRLIMIIWLLLVMLFITSLGAKSRGNDLTSVSPLIDDLKPVLCRSSVD